MTAPYKYRSEPWTKVCTSDDRTKAALDLLGGKKGITGEFKYSTLGIQILAGVIENASGIKCIDFANRYLFDPLGIPEHHIHGASSKEDQFDYLMNKAPRKNEWYSDPQGTVTAGWGLCLSAKDMARIAHLLVQNAEKALRKEGIIKIFGLVFKDNETANAFWEEHGYILRTNLNYRIKSLNQNVPQGE